MKASVVENLTHLRYLIWLPQTHGFMELKHHGQVIASAMGVRWVGCLHGEHFVGYWLQPCKLVVCHLWSLGGLGVVLDEMVWGVILGRALDT